MTNMENQRKVTFSAYGLDEAQEFVLAQFNASVSALERTGILQAGEFEKMMLATGSSVYERIARTENHLRIAEAIFAAISRGDLLEEEFNIWSGRRKIDGEPIKIRFEQLYLSCCSTQISRMRGTLTAIVRAYQHKLEGLIYGLIATGKTATDPAELLQVERQAVESGLLSLELLNGGLIDGWPTFLRANGRFRGASKLREFFDVRQHELPMSEEMATELIVEMSHNEKVVARNR